LSRTVSKVVFIGEGGVGKTSLVNKLLGSGGLSDSPTIGIDIKTIVTENVQIVVWDLGGQERFKLFADDFIIGAKLIVLVFDLNKSTSFFRLYEWAKRLRQKIRNPYTKIILVGNKSDLERTVDREAVNKFIRESQLNIVEYIETSAKTGENVDSLLKLLKKHSL